MKYKCYFAMLPVMIRPDSIQPLTFLGDDVPLSVTPAALQYPPANPIQGFEYVNEQEFEEVEYAPAPKASPSPAPAMSPRGEPKPRWATIDQLEYALELGLRNHFSEDEMCRALGVASLDKPIPYANCEAFLKKWKEH